MKKKLRDTIIFFTIFYWLLFYILIIRNKLIVEEITIGKMVIFVFIYMIIILSSRYLVPVFELILKLTGKIGNVIFGLITGLVYYLILTPIALYKKITKQELLKVKIDKNKKTYYEDWEEGISIEKQY